MFSGRVPAVSGTRIYAGPRDEAASAYQRIAYQMTAAVPDSLAMVLPIPTPPNPAEDAVTFVDMSSCAWFFTQLDTLFPAEQTTVMGAPLARGGFGPPQNLVVHDVGDFEASFVPSLSDFARLDERFRLPDEVWSKLPQYADWSFCVFKLKPQPGQKKGLFSFFSSDPPPPPRKHHPMAFDFPRRNPHEIFFPTVHVHDGEVHDTADFDHSLYVQLDGPAEGLKGWESQGRDTPRLLDAALKFVRPERRMFRKHVKGSHPNRDIVVPTST